LGTDTDAVADFDAAFGGDVGTDPDSGADYFMPDADGIQALSPAGSKRVEI